MRNDNAKLVGNYPNSQPQQDQFRDSPHANSCLNERSFMQQVADVRGPKRTRSPPITSFNGVSWESSQFVSDSKRFITYTIADLYYAFLIIVLLYTSVSSFCFALVLYCLLGPILFPQLILKVHRGLCHLQTMLLQLPPSPISPLLRKEQGLLLCLPLVKVCRTTPISLNLM